MERLKYIAVAVLLFIVSFVGGCVGADARTAEADVPARMSYIEGASANSGWFEIYKDNRTGVHYLLYQGGNGYGRGAAMCVLVDAEGKPLVDRGE